MALVSIASIADVDWSIYAFSLLKKETVIINEILRDRNGSYGLLLNNWYTADRKTRKLNYEYKRSLNYWKCVMTIEYLNLDTKQQVTKTFMTFNNTKHDAATVVAEKAIKYLNIPIPTNNTLATKTVSSKIFTHVNWTTYSTDLLKNILSKINIVISQRLPINSIGLLKEWVDDAYNTRYTQYVYKKSGREWTCNLTIIDTQTQLKKSFSCKQKTKQLARKAVAKLATKYLKLTKSNNKEKVVDQKDNNTNQKDNNTYQKDNNTNQIPTISNTIPVPPPLPKKLMSYKNNQETVVLPLRVLSAATFDKNLLLTDEIKRESVNVQQEDDTLLDTVIV